MMYKGINSIPKISVIIRKRPLNKKQIGRGQKDIIQTPNDQTVLVKQQKVKVDLTPYVDQYKFIFDRAFGHNVTNQNVKCLVKQIYVSTVRPLIDAAYDGARVSCFAYGQTGSGKTYTMLGDGQSIRGLYLLAAQDVFEMRKNFPDVTVWVSFYEIYCGKLYDLLNERNLLHARQDAKNNINIVGLTQRKADSITQVINAIQFGTTIRVTSQNGTNDDSSRSHAILQLCLRKNKKIHGKISFIDLAGSQRAADHADQTDKQTKIDGAEINKSLLALKQCIRALDQNKHHVPFRGSKLTMVLKDSFVGYCKTVMIANVSPNSSSCENTLNTLKYADRVKQLKKEKPLNSLPQNYLNNDLSKQLMLPRQMVHHQQISKNHPHHYESENVLMRNNYLDEEIEMKQPPRPIAQKQKSENKSKQKLHHKISPPRGHRSSSTDNHSYLNRLSYESEEDLYEKLGQRHEQMVSKVIQGEENLLAEHQNYINFSVESTKHHIEIMNKADQIGSSIEDYLNKLDEGLQTQMEKIYKMKALIQNLRYNLDQSKKIENLYMEVNRNKSDINLFPQKTHENGSSVHGNKSSFNQPNLGQLNFGYNGHFQHQVHRQSQQLSGKLYLEQEDDLLFQ